MSAAWKTLPFEDVICDETGGNIKTLQSDFLREGQYAIVDQGKELIAGYFDDASRLCRSDLPVIIFGDHTKCFKFIDFPFCLGADGTKVLRPRNGEDPKYLYHYLRQVSLTDAGYSRHFKYLREIKIPLPPLPEQRRIAAILDAADSLRAKRRAALAKLDQLAHEVFWDMFGCRLTASPVNVSKEKLDAPKGWRWSQLTDVARLATGHTPDRKRPDYWGDDLPWITLGDVRALDGKIAIATRECISELGLNNSSAVRLPKGTVCLSRTASVGFVTIMGREMATSQDFVNWECGEALEPRYLMGALIAARPTLLSLANGSTHRTIYFPTVEQFRVIVPPKHLQKLYAQTMTVIADIECSAISELSCLDSLFASLQHRAFRCGEL